MNSTVERSRPSRRQLAAFPALGLFVAMLAGCSSVADPMNEPDCLSPFHFDGREYRLVIGHRHFKPVKPGSGLGEGAYESCAQYGPGGGSDKLNEPEPVYALPSVPSDQAVVVGRVGGHGSVLLAADKPEGGWDPDLRDWLKKSSISR